MLRSFLSYLYPVHLRNIHSDLSGRLELTLINGKKLLDTATTNYSYGSLQRILKKGLRHTALSNMRSILVLGLGGGSVAYTIRKDLRSEAEITLVDVDPAMIRLAEDEFQLSHLGNISLVEADAMDFVQTNDKEFDLVIVDLFVLDTIPQKFTGGLFLNALAARISAGGQLIYNIMRHTMSEAVRRDIIGWLEKEMIRTQLLENIEGSNDLIIGKKETRSASRKPR